MSLLTVKVQCLKCGHKYKYDPAKVQISCPKCGSFVHKETNVGGIEIGDNGMKAGDDGVGNLGKIFGKKK